ncbi:MAG TPA: hypothetical protein VGX69_00380 [Solirubrobacteraceae bacterium]|jgi:hypothetical protein|nr:hypothetical protein [Solirubrobacteraceae bacterium]
MTERLDVGAVIRRVFDIYVDQAPVLLPASAVVFVISGIIAALLFAAGNGLALVGFLISFVAGVVFTGMIVELVADVQDGRRDHSPGELLRAVAPVLGQLILVGIVAAIGIGVGFVLILVPGLILMTIWAVAAPVVVLERPNGVARALGRSRELVRGNGWQVFGVVLLLAFVIQVLAAIVDVAAASASSAVGIVVRVVLGILIGPLSALAAAVLYFELRNVQSAASVESPLAGLPPDEPVGGIAERPPAGVPERPPATAPQAPPGGDEPDPPLPA